MADRRVEKGGLGFVTSSADETRALGRALAPALADNKKACIALRGELGAGKTCFAQGVMAGLGARDMYLPSPSYTLVNQYRIGGRTVYHCDLYRLEGAEQAGELGLEECLEAGVVLIEWPEVVLPGLKKAGALLVNFSHLEEGRRFLEMVPFGHKYFELLQAINITSIDKKSVIV